MTSTDDPGSLVKTFTPYADVEQSLRSLDLKRLGKQRVEVIRIVRALRAWICLVPSSGADMEGT